MNAIDEELMARVAAGCRESLGKLYDRHAQSMMALGLRLLRQRTDAEEVLHDVVLEAWRRAGDYDPARGSVRTWLLTRMRSRCVDRLKSPGRVRVRSVGASIEDFADGRRSRPDSTVDSERLHDAVFGLPVEQRRVIELGYFAGLSFSSVADALGIPLGTVKSRMHAAMSKLRAELADAG